MPAGHTPIGDRLYLFSIAAGAQHTAACTIDAHGEQPLVTGTFALRPGLTVRFYVQQGATLAVNIGHRNPDTPNEYYNSNALEAISTGVANATESYTGPIACPDYTLRKMHKSTSGPLGGRWSNFIDERSVRDYTSLERYIDARPASTDIITIRNRVGKSALTLSEIISLLPPAYTEIRCCFCRSSQLPWKTSPKEFVSGAARPAHKGGGVY